MRCIILLGLGVCGFFGASSVAHAQSFTLRVDSAVVGEGQSFTTRAEIDLAGTTSPGWSFGVCHDPLLIELSGAVSGAATQIVNNGAPPEYESLDLYVDGLTHAVVVCFMGCATLPAGTSQELVEMTYNALGPIGTVTDACFCDTLGSPPVQTVVVYDLFTQAIPATVCGSFEIQEVVVPVSNLICSSVEIECRCDADLSWFNAEAYDEIRIYRDGTLLDTLPGDQAAYTSADELGLREFCIEAVRGGIVSELTCCTVQCDPVDVPALAVTDLTCVVDQDLCVAAVGWSNPVEYESIEILLDGTVVETLTGLNNGASVDLGGDGIYEICVVGTTFCGDVVPATCCTAACGSGIFIRSDVNQDGTNDIADPIAMLAFLFSGGTLPDCADALDANDDGNTDIADAVFTLAYLFQAGDEPPAPFTACGPDPTADSLLCVEYNACP